jgi:hypothetical protein
MVAPLGLLLLMELQFRMGFLPLVLAAVGQQEPVGLRLCMVTGSCQFPLPPH